MLYVAAPPTSITGDPTGRALMLNCTVPAGVKLPSITFAVNVTVCPRYGADGETETAVVVGTRLTAVVAVALLFAVFVSDADDTVAVFDTVVPAALNPAFTTS